MAGNKSMGVYAATSIGVGAMIGAGIFSIFGTAVKISENAVYISFIIAGIVALLKPILMQSSPSDIILLADLSSFF